MYAFHYDRETGASLGGTPAEFDQREPGVMLLPAFSTATPPPKYAADEWPFFSLTEQQWILRKITGPTLSE